MGIARLFLKKLYFFWYNFFLLFCTGSPLYFCEFLLIYNVAQYNIAHYFLWQVKPFPLDALTCRWSLLRQNPYLCPDIPLLTGLITAKSLSVPRCTKVEGIIDLILSHIPASAKADGYIRPDFVSHTRVCEGRWVYSTWFYLTYPRPWKSVGIIDLILSHIPAFASSAGYRWLVSDFYTFANKFCWVQIACFWIPYPRQQVLLGTDSLFLNSIPSSTQIHKNTDRQISSLSISIFVCQYLLRKWSITVCSPSHPRTPAAFLRKEP